MSDNSYRKSNRQAFGTVLVFAEGTTEDEAVKILQELIAKSDGLLDSASGLRSYNPDHGEPVWYRP